MKEDIENWYATQTNRIVEEFDDFDKHICNVVLKWQQQVKSVDLADVGSSLRELADKYEMDALKRYETGEHALSHLHMAAQARYGFEDGWKAAKKQ